MKVSLQDAATLMGVTERQVRYLIQTGKLTASKAGGRWVIEQDQLPATEGQQRATQRRHDDLRKSVEAALGEPASPRKLWSVRDLAAFRVGRPCLQKAHTILGPTHPSVSALREALLALGRGYHCFHRGEKLSAYRQARDHGAHAAVYLLLGDEHEAPQALATELEREFLPAVVGLMRHAERQDGRHQESDPPQEAGGPSARSAKRREARGLAS